MDYNIVSESMSSADSVKWSESLAWEHSMMLSDNLYLGVGSDEFVEIYKHLKLRYKVCADNIGFLHNFSATILQELLHTNLGIPVTSEDNDVSIQSRLTNAIMVILSGICWSYASSTEGWEPNDEWLLRDIKDKTTLFKFTQQEKHDNNDR